MTRVTDSILIGKKKVKNRLTFAPTVKFDWAEVGTGVPIKRHAEHYGEIAKYGCGLICVEATCVSPDGRLAPSQLGLWEDGQIDGHKEITDACHQYGSTVIVQIHHAGNTTHPECGVAKGPSSVEGFRGVRSIELTHEEIEAIRDAFIEAAVRAKKAGYDGVQLHACHNYLINQFAHPATNLRTDEYGGNTENRARFGCEIIAGIRESCGEDFLISARTAGAMGTVEEAVAVAKLYVAAGCDYLQVSCGTEPNEPVSAPEGVPYNDIAQLGVLIHEHFKGIVPVSTVNSLFKKETIDYMIEHDLLDRVDLARSLLADPRFSDYVLNQGDYTPCFQCKTCFWSPFMPHTCPASAKRSKEEQ